MEYSKSEHNNKTPLASELVLERPKGLLGAGGCKLKRKGQAPTEGSISVRHPVCALCPMAGTQHAPLGNNLLEHRL